MNANPPTNGNTEVIIDAQMKVQSYCGLLCDTCPYIESHGCKGCLSLKGKQFWGDCSVALCCIEKGYKHCGECPEVPCAELTDFSCGDHEHCDNPRGSRISVCKAWAGK